MSHRLFLQKYNDTIKIAKQNKFYYICFWCNIVFIPVFVLFVFIFVKYTHNIMVGEDNLYDVPIFIVGNITSILSMMTTFLWLRNCVVSITREKHLFFLLLLILLNIFYSPFYYIRTCSKNF